MNTLCALKSIRKSPRRSMGICRQLRDMNAWDPWIYQKFEKWPKFSGNIDFPVPKKYLWVIEGDPENAFWTTMADGDMWDRDTQYGRDRWELLDFLIQEKEMN